MSHRAEDEVIRRFVGYLNRKLYPGLEIIDWPDKRPGVSGQGEIDTLAITPALQVAIEHTSLDSFPDQRLDDQRFRAVFDHLERKFEARQDLNVSIGVSFGAVQPGLNWAKISENLESWIDRVVPIHQGASIQTVPGVPFPLMISRKPYDAPLTISRIAPAEGFLGFRLKALVLGKSTKLVRYKEKHHLTIMLIENSDPANMSRGIMIQTVAEQFAEGLPSGVDKIWFADTSAPTSYFWNLTPDSRRELPIMTAQHEFENPQA